MCNEYLDHLDEWGNVTCRQCGTVSDLWDGRRETPCEGCGRWIDSRTGLLVLRDLDRDLRRLPEPERSAVFLGRGRHGTVKREGG